MFSHILGLSSRSRRLLWRNQYKEYQESVADGSTFTADAKSTRSFRSLRPISTLFRLWDPVVSLPPEIALMCLRDALPSGGDYPAALIELTSVSSIWQQFLFSASGLWTEIHVRYSAHDLMVVISLFLHLSAKAPLNLIVWNTLGFKWEDIKSLLLPHTDRIHSLALGDHPPIYSDSPYTGAAYISLALEIFNSLHQLPCLVNLDFGRALQVDPSQLKPLDMTSDIRVNNTISVSLQDSESLCRSIILLSGRETQCNTFTADHPMLSDFPTDSTRSHFTGGDYNISSLNSNISSLVDILTSLGCPETTTRVSTSSLYKIFVNISSNRCLLCNRERGSLSTALGCVRFHFGLRPFRCPGCRTCNDNKGYARFCTSHLLRNHIGPTTCVVCGDQQSASWGQDTSGDPLCSACLITPAPRETGAFQAIQILMQKQIPLKPGRKVALRLPDEFVKANSPPPIMDGTLYQEGGWILAIIHLERNGKYAVQDVEYVNGQEPPIYTVSLSSIIPLPMVSVAPDDPSHLNAYPEYRSGTIVLALYPETTSFYKAEVVASPKEMLVAGARAGPVVTRAVPSYKLRFDEDEDRVRLISAEEVIWFPGY